jgi:hypothetical protein
MIDATTMQPGETLDYKGQPYVLLRRRPYTRQDGNPTTLADWQSQCPRCGQTFEQTTSMRLRWLNRRCSTCKQPGIRVQQEQLAVANH